MRDERLSAELLNADLRRRRQRMFRRKDVEMLLNIKQLLYEKKFTIEGARKELKSEKTSGRQEELFPGPLSGIRQELAEILKLLS